MQSIILVTRCIDLEFLDVSSAVDCIQLALAIRYGLHTVCLSEVGGRGSAGPRVLD